MLLWLEGNDVGTGFYARAAGDVDDLIFADCDWHVSER